MSEGLRVLIVDDESRARGLVRKMLAGDHEIEIVGDCSNGYEAVSAIKDTKPDLVFLDVQMPEMDGFGVLHQLEGAKFPAVVFVTAFDQYAVKAFEVHALDYLLKPYDRERFQAVLQHAKAELRARLEMGQSDRVTELLQKLKEAQQFFDRLAVKQDGRILLLELSDVVCIEAEDNYVRLQLAGQSYLLRETLTHLESRLDPEFFLRVHRSTIINVKKLEEIQPVFHGEYLLRLSNKKSVTLSRTYRDAFFQRFGHPN